MLIAEYSAEKRQAVEALITAMRVFSAIIARLVRSADDHHFYVLLAIEPAGGHTDMGLAKVHERDKETLLHECIEGHSEEFVFDPPLPLDECTKKILKKRGLSE